MVSLKWRIGVPERDGIYIITTIDGAVDTSYFSVNEGWEYPLVIAWFPVNEIIPYKDE